MGRSVGGGRCGVSAPACTCWGTRLCDTRRVRPAYDLESGDSCIMNHLYIPARGLLRVTNTRRRADEEGLMRFGGSGAGLRDSYAGCAHARTRVADAWALWCNSYSLLLCQCNHRIHCNYSCPVAILSQSIALCVQFLLRDWNILPA